MSDTSKAILLVADISGYTKFMKIHAVSTNHAKQIIVRLLKSVIQASKPPLKVAELEADAVFFYALSTEKDLKKTADQVKDQILRFFSGFNDELATLKQMTICKCDACTKVDELRLKQVIHIGDVAIEKIDRFEKLFGMDVIVVHRMLKNSVPSHEYVMMTDPVYKSFVDFFGEEPEHRVEQFEGVGEVQTLVFYPGSMSRLKEQEGGRSKVSFLGKLAWTARLEWGQLLELLGIRKTGGAFNNLPA